MLLKTGLLEFYIFKITSHFWKSLLNHWARPNVAILGDVMALFPTSMEEFCGKSFDRAYKKDSKRGFCQSQCK